MSKLDGQFALGEYTLTFNVNTFCDLEEAFEAQDVNAVLAIIQGLEQHPSLRTIRTIFHAALKQEHPEVSLADTGKLITDVGIEKAAAALGDAVAQAFPDTSGEEEVGNAKRGAGKKS